MIHLTGAMGRDANDAVVHAMAMPLECAQRVTRRGWPSSEVSRPLLPLNPLNGGAPGTDGSATRTGVATAAVSLDADGVSRDRAADSGPSSDRATADAGLEGVAGGACTPTGLGARGGVTGRGSKSGSRERSIRGRGSGAARRTSFWGAGVRVARGRLTTSRRGALESTDGFARSRAGAVTGGAAGTGAFLAGNCCCAKLESSAGFARSRVGSVGGNTGCTGTGAEVSTRCSTIGWLWSTADPQRPE
jgi:hypothetical protein